MISENEYTYDKHLAKCLYEVKKQKEVI